MSDGTYVFFGEREFLMWIVIMVVLALIGLLALFYLVTRFHRFSFIKALESRSRLLSWLAACLPLALPAQFLLFNVTTVIVVLLHLMAAFLLCTLLFALLRKLTKRAISYDYQGAAAVLLTVVYLAVGWYNAHHVFQTEYRIESTKPLQRDYRIVELADSHLGITQNGADSSPCA